MTTLLLSSRHSADSQRLWRAAISRGWATVRMQGATLPEIDLSEQIVVSIEALFGPMISQKYSLQLEEPAESWLAELPHQ